jgi:hypothetical protein
MHRRKNIDASLDPPLDGLMYLLAGYINCELTHMDNGNTIQKDETVSARCSVRSPLTQEALAWLRCHIKYWVDLEKKTSELGFDAGSIEQKTPDVGLSAISLTYRLVEKAKPTLSSGDLGQG